MARKALVSSSYVVIDPGRKEWSHSHTLFLRENGNKRRRIASLEAPLIFKMLHTSKHTKRCKLGSSKIVLPNCDCCTMDMRSTLSSKLLATMRDRYTRGLAMGAWGDISRRVRLYASSPPAIEDVVCSFCNALCIFNL